MKNRRFIFLSAIQVFSVLIELCFAHSIAIAEENTTHPDTLTFIQITDTHICNLTGYQSLFVDKRQHFGKNAEPFAQFLKSVPKKSKADFVVITGDNIDYYEAETEKGEMLDTQVEQYTRLLGLSDVPVYLTLGNHDIASYWVNSDSTYTSNQFHAERARATWIRNTPCFRDGTYYSRVFNIDTTSFRFIFLDNGYYPTNKGTNDTLPFYIDTPQLLWLDAQLNASTSDIEIIFMHIPLPFNKSNDKSISTEPISDNTSKSRFFSLLSVLEKNSSSRVIFAGHKHINSTNNYIFPNGNELTQIMTGAFGYDADNWRKIIITSKNIIVCFPGSSKIEYRIEIM